MLLNKKIVLVAFYFFLLLMPLTGSDWAMYMGNHHLTGNNDNVVPSNLELAWRYQAPGLIFHSVASDGVVLCATLRGKVTALDISSGRMMWQFDPRYPVIRMPVVYKDMVYISAGKFLYCVDKWNGKLRWGRRYQGFSQLSTPVVENGVLYYGNRGAFFARNAYTGGLLWQNDSIQSYGGSPVYAWGRIYTQHRDYSRLRYYLVSLDARTGRLVWKKSIERDANVFTPLVYRGIVYMASGFELRSFDAMSGTAKALYRFPKRIGSNPMVVAGKLYISTSSGKIAQLDVETLRVLGSFRHFRARGNRFVSVGKWLYLADDAGTVYEISRKNGKVRRKYASGARQTHALPLLFEGRVLFPAGKTLFCLGRYPREKRGPQRRGEVRLVFFNKKSGARLWGKIALVIRSEKKTRYLRRELTDGALKLDEQAFPAKITVEKKGFLFHVVKLGKLQQGRTIKIFLKPINKGSKLVFHDILFNSDSSGLLSASLPGLGRLVRFMKQNPRLRISIHGHTDNTGSIEHNNKLSLARAKVVRNYLVKHNIRISRLRVCGFGSKKPIASNATKQGRQLNRRTEIKIIGYFSQVIRSKRDESDRESE